MELKPGISTTTRRIAHLLIVLNGIETDSGLKPLQVAGELLIVLNGIETSVVPVYPESAALLIVLNGIETYSAASKAVLSSHF